MRTEHTAQVSPRLGDRSLGSDDARVGRTQPHHCVLCGRPCADHYLFGDSSERFLGCAHASVRPRLEAGTQQSVSVPVLHDAKVEL
jgi:hypothetical protein